MEFLFKRLIVWQKAMELSKEVYALARMLPVDEKFALCDQLRRAVVSVASNIAEGNGRATSKDYAHFLAIARGSLYEVITQLELAKELGYINDYDEVAPLAEEVSRMLTAMLKKYGLLEEK